MIIADRNRNLEDYTKKLGNTSLVKVETYNGCNIYAKYEFENPTGSIKDRAAYAMVKNLIEGSEEEEIENLEILEYSGGNLAIALSEICKVLNIKINLVLMENTNDSIKKRLKQNGANLYFSKKENGFYGVMQKAFELSEANSNWKFLYQHKNHNNVEAHYNGTGLEICDQFGDNKIDAWVSAVGTGGTLIGVYKRIKEQNPNLIGNMVMPLELPYGSPEPPNSLKKLAGTGGLGNGRKQHFVEPFDNELSQWNIAYDEAFQEMKSFYEKNNEKIGSSAAGNLLACKKLALELPKGSNIITVFPDRGTKEEWEQIQKL